MVSVVIPYHSNREGLAVTLANLQSQIIQPERIVVIDTSKDKSGLKIASRYNTNTLPIIVECAQVSIYQAWNKGIELCSGSDVLIINDDLLMPQNFIDILMMASKFCYGWVYVPQTPPREHSKDSVDREFGWYAEPQLAATLTSWMPGFCFMLTEECIERVGVFDESFKVWYGDTDYEKRIQELAIIEPHLNPIIRLDNCFVYHYGGSSFDYTDPKVKRLVNKDRKLFKEKYG